MNHELSKTSESYIGIINNQIVCFCAVIQFPLLKGSKMIHRLVVLPDYQGIGVGIKFLNEVSKIYNDKGWNVRIITSSPSLSNGLIKNKNWILYHKGRKSNDKERKTTRNRITFSFLFKE